MAWGVLEFATLIGGVAVIWGVFNWIAGRFRKDKPPVAEHDRSLYQAYRVLLVDSGAAEYLARHDYGGSFAAKYWSPLSQYVDSWVTADHQFVDPDLNAAHQRAYAAAHALASAIALGTVPIGTGALRSVKPDYLPAGPTPAHILADADTINALRPAFLAAHGAFVRAANAKLV